jgi:hypothetical protein
MTSLVAQQGLVDGGVRCIPPSAAPSAIPLGDPPLATRPSAPLGGPSTSLVSRFLCFGTDLLLWNRRAETQMSAMGGPPPATGAPRRGSRQ